ncbi:PREDICTED: RNA polymerase II subunit 5-mediating protein homolog isoform X3 [Prunus mume]|uniref:RNA polymerase II subunit 5-mediating protein homolog isoform X3 n=1 Tax=Prunus mume TaxID=102107 RepID=A0ABM0NNW5_PRUMU|nr:PREDICTED: RNA polymerase II subunit 5-mediating protein homolog isoform X3 [Prunus mume]
MHLVLFFPFLFGLFPDDVQVQCVLTDFLTLSEKMEEAAKGKGTVTSLSSLFPVEDAQKAAKRLQDSIAERQQMLDQLGGFVADNASLINLVRRLPDHLHHDIMVPFGKAAFFPGRLVHTNEFLVLLGEGYYAERTSRQTLEILKRRGMALDSQVDSLNAMLNDLRLEASFLDATASEAAEGLVEIREDYAEETSSEKESEPGPCKQASSSSSGADFTKVADEDEEFARIASRMDELEKEELEAENEAVSLEQTKDEFAAESNDESDEDEQVEADLHQYSDHKSLHQNVKFSECLGLTVQPIAKVQDRSSHGNILACDVKSSSGKALVAPQVHNAQAVHLSRSQEVPLQSSKPEFDGQKAFTGSIIERTHNQQTTSREQTTTTSQSSGSQPPKPVSRFKMQRK